MRVVHILNELRPSGAEMMLRVAAPYWRSQGLDMDILSKGIRLGVYAQELEDAGYSIHHIPFLDPVRFLLSYVRFLLQNRYDVVHVHTEHGNFWLALLAKLCGVPSVVRTLHSVFRFGGILRVERWIQRRVLTRSGVRHVSIGKSVAETERQLYRNATTIIPNWYDPERFQVPTSDKRELARARWGLAPDDLALISVGNCADVKNHCALLEALGALANEIPFVYLHAGEEGEEGERELAVSIGIGDRVRFLGFVGDVASLLHAGDVMVMPSKHEGYGIAAVEAMAAGVPTVLTDVPGLRDLRELSDEIVWVQPSVDSIAGGIRALAALTTDARRARGRRLSQAVSAHLSVERSVDAYLNAYRKAAVKRMGRQLASEAG